MKTPNAGVSWAQLIFFLLDGQMYLSSLSLVFLSHHCYKGLVFGSSHNGVFFVRVWFKLSCFCLFFEARSYWHLLYVNHAKLIEIYSGKITCSTSPVFSYSSLVCYSFYSSSVARGLLDCRLSLEELLHCHPKGLNWFYSSDLTLRGIMKIPAASGLTWHLFQSGLHVNSWFIASRLAIKVLRWQ